MITAILLGEKDEEIGRTVVPPAAMLIKCREDFFVKTGEAKRLTFSGTGMGVIYRLADVYERRVTPSQRAAL